MRIYIFICTLSFFLLPLHAVYSQDDLMNLLDDDVPGIDYTNATFKATRIILGQSIENPANGNLIFMISHHFGRINSGWYEFFGLDQANIRLGFEYGITDWLAVGIGRTSYQKTYDGFVKAKILRQSKGARKMPISLSYFGSISIISLKWEEPERENYFSSRLQYAHQVLIARKFNRWLSLQLMPSMIHRNLVPTKEDQNDVYSIGVGGRAKVSDRMALTGEYYYLLPGKTADDFTNSLSIGVDIETGGHVFQLYLTNSLGLIEQQFIPITTGLWSKGDIHIGFNISRTFVLKRKKEFKD